MNLNYNPCKIKFLSLSSVCVTAFTNFHDFHFVLGITYEATLVRYLCMCMCSCMGSCVCVRAHVSACVWKRD